MHRDDAGECCFLLFEAFTREKSSSENGIMGTGLGLRIVKSFTDLMNGSVSVESEPGKGSCFTVLLPCRISEEKELSKDSKEDAVQEETLKNKRILLAEDNELNAEIAVTILQDAHAEVEAAGDGEADGSQEKNSRKNWKEGQVKKLKFTYMEQKEWETIEDEIAKLEQRIEELGPEIDRAARDYAKLSALMKEKEGTEALLEQKMERWMYLNDLSERIEQQNSR